MQRPSFWTWFWVILGGLYFALPIYGTLDFSLRAIKGQLSLVAYQRVFDDSQFLPAFAFSAQMALITIGVSLLLIVPTAYWVHLRLPRWRPVIEFFTLLPFVTPAVVLVFGLIRTYGRPPFVLTQTQLGTDFLLVAGYMVLIMPFMYRAIDNGLRTLDVRALTEAAQSLGASWTTIIFQVIFPNLRGAIISGALIAFATVVGELVLASFLARPALGVYMVRIGANKAYEPAALAMMSYALTWAALAAINLIGGNAQSQTATIK